MLFSVRLDESGTDGRSPNVVVAGAVALVSQWVELERRWLALLQRSNVGVFHSKEFNDRSGDFSGWGNLKCQRFVKAQEKIIDAHTAFQVAVSVNSAEHKTIKKKMQGIKGYKPDSDYGLCFRVIRFTVSEILNTKYPGSKISFLVETGPFSAGAGVIYSHIKQTIGSKSPAAHAGMLAGFAQGSKKEARSLEVADYLSGRAIREVGTSRFMAHEGQMTTRMTPEFLQVWYEGMIKEKARRTEFNKAKMLAFSQGQSS